MGLNLSMSNQSRLDRMRILAFYVWSGRDISITRKGVRETFNLSTLETKGKLEGRGGEGNGGLETRIAGI